MKIDGGALGTGLLRKMGFIACLFGGNNFAILYMIFHFKLILLSHIHIIHYKKLYKTYAIVALFQKRSVPNLIIIGVDSNHKYQ